MTIQRVYDRNSLNEFCGAHLSYSGTASPAGCGWDCGTRGPGRSGLHRLEQCVDRGRRLTSSPGPAGCVGWCMNSAYLQNPAERAVRETRKQRRHQSKRRGLKALRSKLRKEQNNAKRGKNKLTKDVLRLINSSEIQQWCSFSFSGKKLRLDTLINW